MYFENTGIEDQKVDIVVADDLMRSHGLIRATGWDFERVTWDRKFVVADGTYYLRIFAVATEGDIGANDAVVKLLKPVLGKHYFPHGVEYSEAEIWPTQLVDRCKTILDSIHQDLNTFAIKA